VLGLVLDVLVVGGSREAVITGLALLSLAAGCAMLAQLSRRRTDQPQGWARNAALAFGVTGALLLVLRPSGHLRGLNRLGSPVLRPGNPKPGPRSGVFGRSACASPRPSTRYGDALGPGDEGERQRCIRGLYELLGRDMRMDRVASPTSRACLFTLLSSDATARGAAFVSLSVPSR
jgi:hypothetical protein